MARLTWDRVLGAVATWATYVLFWVQPGVDRKAVVAAVMNHEPGNATTGMGLVAVVVFGVIPAVSCLCYAALYHYEMPFFERYRVDGDKAGWHSKDADVRAAYAQLNKDATKGMAWRLLALILGCWLVFHIQRTVFGLWGAEHSAQVIAATPEWHTSAWQLAIGLVLFETNFYWLHVMQHKYWYEAHKIHHQYSSPNVLTASWGAHFDGATAELIPHLLIPYVLGYHPYTFWMWMTIMYTHTYLDHSGYEFPWCPLQLIPFSGYVRAHNFHHTANCCNFGLYWRFWDWAMGTNKEWVEHERKRELRINAQDAVAANKKSDAASHNGNGNGSGNGVTNGNGTH